MPNRRTSLRKLAGATTVFILLAIPAWRTSSQQRAAAGRDTASAKHDDHASVGQQGGVAGGVPKTCEPLGSGSNDGLPMLPSENVKAWIEYADALCFVETIKGDQDEPASHIQPKSKNAGDAEQIALWILPEQHVHKLAADVLRGKTGNRRNRIVAKIANADPYGRPFRAWGKPFKHGGAPAFLVVVPTGDGEKAKVHVIRFKDPRFWFASVDTLTTAPDFFEETYGEPPRHKHARAHWGRVKGPAGGLRVLDQHNTGWFDCPSGCCGAQALW